MVRSVVSVVFCGISDSWTPWPMTDCESRLFRLWRNDVETTGIERETRLPRCRLVTLGLPRCAITHRTYITFEYAVIAAHDVLSQNNQKGNSDKNYIVLMAAQRNRPAILKSRNVCRYKNTKLIILTTT